MKSLGQTIMGRLLGLLADAVIRFRWLFLWPQLLLFGLAIIYTAKHLEFDPSRDNLVGSGKSYHQNYLNFKKEFPSQDDLVVVVESEDPEKNRQFVERLGAKLEVETNIFTNVIYRTDLRMLGRKALLFVPEEDLRGLQTNLADFLPFIQRFSQVTNLDSLFGLVNSQFLHAKNEANKENNALIGALPMMQRIVDQAAASLQRPGIPPSPGITALFGGGDEDVYIVFTNQLNSNRIYLVTAQAKTEDLNDAAVDRLRFLIARTEGEVPGLNIGVTGGPVLDHDEMVQSQKDSTFASIFSLILCSLIFIYGYQETGRPLKATLCLLVGLAYSLAFTTATIGHLNILTITFLPIIIGLAIDFGVHLITRYEEELRLGKREEEALHRAMVYTGQGIFTGALTTAAAFLAMVLTNFRGIQEMGAICGAGMLICFIPMMTMLPVMLFRGRQNRMDQEQAHKPPLRSRLERVWLRRPVATVLVTVALTVVAISKFYKVHFDYDLLDMQSKGLPAVVFEKKLIDSAGKSVLFAAVQADSAEQAVELGKEIMKLTNEVNSVDSIATNLVGEQKKQRQLIRQIKADIAPLHFAPEDRRPADVWELSSTLYSTAGYMGAAADDIGTNEPALAAQMLNLRDSIFALRRQMLSDGEAQRDAAASKLGEFQQSLFTDVHDTFQALQEQEDSTPLRAQDLPPALRSRFIGVTGKFLLQVYPKDDVWQRNNQEHFVKALQKIDPKVTGTPVQLYYYTELLKESYQKAAWYALIIIAIMIFVHFRTLSSVMLALLPVGIGFIWLVGLMGWLGILFDPANIMTLPLVIGIGVTNGIQILNRFAEEKNPGILSKSTGKAVFVSGLTAISGFGSLILARHQGIRSLGEVMSIGVATCMIVALTLLPALLTLWTPGRVVKNQPSGDNA